MEKYKGVTSYTVGVIRYSSLKCFGVLISETVGRATARKENSLESNWDTVRLPKIIMASGSKGDVSNERL